MIEKKKNHSILYFFRHLELKMFVMDINILMDDSRHGRLIFKKMDELKQKMIKDREKDRQTEINGGGRIEEKREDQPNEK